MPTGMGLLGGKDRKDVKILNYEFENWSSGTTDAQPDSWSDYESSGVTGTNNRESTTIYSGVYALNVSVTASTGSSQYKGVTQSILSRLTKGVQYTLSAWVQNTTITNGVIKVSTWGDVSGFSFALNSGTANTSYTQYTVTFTPNVSDTQITLALRIANSGSNSVSGTAYFDRIEVYR